MRNLITPVHKMAEQVLIYSELSTTVRKIRICQNYEMTTFPMMIIISDETWNDSEIHNARWHPSRRRGCSKFEFVDLFCTQAALTSQLCYFDVKKNVHVVDLGKRSKRSPWSLPSSKQRRTREGKGGPKCVTTKKRYSKVQTMQIDIRQAAKDSSLRDLLLLRSDPCPAFACKTYFK